ncbi:MAG: phage holin family protein [Elusimicrobia bacterium]|nr:phage holin family protein [Elusimicrobiota bacterium]MDE2314406.1 phage holin family protein [Elusimicrobiota bacterium]
MKTLVHILISAVAVYVAARVLPGISVDGPGTALAVAVVLGVINALIRPVLLLLTFPINLMTLGLLTFAIMGLCVEGAAAVVPGFEVHGFLWAMAFAVVFAFLNWFLNAAEKI